MVHFTGLDALKQDLPSLVTGGTLPAPLPANFHGMLSLAEFVQHVIQGSQRMAPGHSRTGKAHHVTHFLPLGGLVAMDRAFGTGRFILAVGAFFQPSRCIIHQAITFFAQISTFMLHMMMVTVNPRHADKRIVFVFQSG